jgi:hypothetical protein
VGVGADHTGLRSGGFGDVLPDPFGDSEGVVKMKERTRISVDAPFRIKRLLLA